MGAGLVSLGIRSWAALHRRRMQKLRFHRGLFFNLAERVLTEDETTDVMLDELKRMVADIDSPHRFSVLAAAVKNLADDAKPDGTLEGAEITVAREWQLLLFHYWLAISYLKSIRGVFLRSAMTGVLYPGSANKALAMAYRHGETRALLPV